MNWWIRSANSVAIYATVKKKAGSRWPFPVANYLAVSQK